MDAELLMDAGLSRSAVDNSVIAGEYADDIA